MNQDLEKSNIKISYLSFAPKYNPFKLNFNILFRDPEKPFYNIFLCLLFVGPIPEFGLIAWKDRIKCYFAFTLLQYNECNIRQVEIIKNYL